jgi:hypothetical protein
MADPVDRPIALGWHGPSSRYQNWSASDRISSPRASAEAPVQPDSSASWPDLELPGAQRVAQRLTLDPVGHGDAVAIHIG